MASDHHVRKLERLVLQAAALGSVKLLRNLLHSHARLIRQEYRNSSKRDNDDHHKSRRSRGRAREEVEETQRGQRGRKGEDRSIDQGEDCVNGEEQSRKWKKARRGEGRRELSTCEGPQVTEGFSLFSGRPENSSKDEGSMESDGAVAHDQRKWRNINSFFKESMRNFVNCRDADGLSPLHHACQAGSEKLVKYLISKGGSVHVRDAKGNTPLHIAAKLGPALVVSYLEFANADMEAFNDEGVTPSDILNKKNADIKRASKLKVQQQWHSHLAEELSDNDDTWWGTDWGDESEQPDWEDPYLERMAESTQGRGLYDEPFYLRNFIRVEKGKVQGTQERPKMQTRHRERATKDQEMNRPEAVGPKKKVLIETQSYSNGWKTFSESYDLCLSYSSVPFPVEEGKEEMLAKVLFQGINPSMYRDVLRKEMLKWHPDKFLQKWGSKLQGPDHDRIVARVNGISQAINQLYKNLTTAK